MSKRLSLHLVALAATTLLLIVPSTAAAGDTPCTGALTGTFDNIVVPPGATCNLSNSLVRGNVKALEDSTFNSFDNVIRGSIEGDKADDVFVVRNDVRGNIQAKEGDAGVAICGTTVRTGNIQIEKFDDPLLGIVVGGGPCVAFGLGGGNIVERGNVKVEENRIVAAAFGFNISNNRVAQNLQVFKNRGSGAKVVQNNTGGGDLQCFENDSPFAGSPNTFPKEEGQCS